MKKLVKDMVLNIIFIAGGIVVALLIPTQVKGMNASVQMGPDFFPYIAAGLMVAVNGIALVTNYRRYQKERAAGTEELVQKTDQHSILNQDSCQLLKKFDFFVFSSS